MKTAILTLCLFCACAWSSRGQVSQRLSENIYDQLRQLRYLTNCEFVTHSTIGYAPKLIGSNGWGRVESDTTYTYDGDRHRLDYVISFANCGFGAVSNWHSAYESNTYSWFRGDINQLIYSKQKNVSEPFSMPNPIFANYLFLSSESDSSRGCYPTLAELASIQTPAPLFTNLISANETEADFKSGLCEGIETSWRVDWRAQDYERGNFTPKYVKRVFKNKSVVSFELIDYTNAPCMPQALLVPSGYKLTAYDQAGNLLITGLVQVISINTTLQKSAEFFTLRDLNARSIFNGDSQRLEKSAPTPPLDPAVKKQRSMARVLVFCAILMPAIIYIIKKSYKTRFSHSLQS